MNRTDEKCSRKPGSSDNQIVQSGKDLQQPDRSGAYTIPLLCAGIAVIAFCMLIPSMDEVRRLVYEREKLRRDLDQIEKQIVVYDDFLKRVAGDPALLELLAQRQMRFVRKGTGVLELHNANDRENRSPYELVNLPPPVEVPEFRPVGGIVANLCRQPRSRLLLMGSGMLLIAFGLVIGSGGRPAGET